MNQHKHNRLMAVAPATHGFGYVVMEGGNSLVDWGVKIVKRDKNNGCLRWVDKLAEHFQPDVLVLQNTRTKDSRRSKRIQELTGQMIEWARGRKLKVAKYSGRTVTSLLSEGGKGTKHSIAERMAGLFPEELGPCLPKRRRIWMAENRKMAIFEAAALAVVFRMKKAQKT